MLIDDGTGGFSASFSHFHVFEHFHDVCEMQSALESSHKVQVLLNTKCFIELMILWRAGNTSLSVHTVYWKFGSEKKGQRLWGCGLILNFEIF